MSACIVGWSHSKFGKLIDEDVESLIISAAKSAIEDANLEPEDIDAIYLGWYNGGFSKQDFGSSLVLNGIDGLRFKPSTRVENACATGSAAIHQAANFIDAKQGKKVLVIGVEKMTSTPNAEVGNILLQASYIKEESGVEGGFAGVFGEIAAGYFQKYGDQSEALARIAAKNHKNGCANPYAHLQKDFGYDFCRQISEKNPIVAGPLKRTDCSMVSDGAAAIVLSDINSALSMDKAVIFRNRTQVNDYLPMSRRDMTYFDGCAKAWYMAFDESNLTIDDLSFIETHDCFTIAELMQYDAMGITEKGKGFIAINEGWTQKDGKIPVNPSGGLKAKGHPIGATGVSMHVMAAMQLTKSADEMQVQGANIGGIFNMGGAGVANYVSILEAIR